ncbi:MAG: type II secretion system protein GspG [Alteromonadaceae bacterium]|mgnify:FL=1|jgi:general secretion pathway protein G|uniref:Type II secretion system core protein G n=1 Tax=Rheinheimera aquimaris TaxID=412437 RepID=A0ABP3PED8_9GAMM|nr:MULTISPECIES: type II secretion system major pseudopilin GspG [Rheinheimera]MBJ92192.1 type II secretion system protein GspG [Alteromonadaceae bacterium]MCB5215587.1 type II secretion system major pseudopilin GspG [Rheinheimera aquimaris]MCD1599687.1 type II secretion system major pseudopilin GspG [Rheinheimera aquimaris]HBN87770.1 type II secretion system protein GspG [Rheinheimera sp.]|tara:strand:+ start:4511 stop:4963 length:453 start_codon:yes stop_codon:yes gene_type:complete
MKRQQNNKQRGFTLLEVMVVIVILGIIASMVVPNLMGNKEQADRQKAVVDIQQLESALDMYRLRNGFYPTTEQGMQALVTAPTSQPVPRAFPDGGFIRRLPKDPWDEDYILISPGQVGRIDILTKGPDRTAGTEDDIGNWNLDANEAQSN